MSNQQWQRVCAETDLFDDTGVCALVDSQGADSQVAIFKVSQSEQQLYAIGNFDPIGKANVLYRGIVGSVANEPVVASPLYKQHFSLTNGKCLQEQDVSVPVYPVRVNDGFIELLA